MVHVPFCLRSLFFLFWFFSFFFASFLFAAFNWHLPFNYKFWNVINVVRLFNLFWSLIGLLLCVLFCFIFWFFFWRISNYWKNLIISYTHFFTYKKYTAKETIGKSWCWTICLTLKLFMWNWIGNGFYAWGKRERARKKCLLNANHGSTPPPPVRFIFGEQILKGCCFWHSCALCVPRKTGVNEIIFGFVKGTCVRWPPQKNDAKSKQKQQKKNWNWKLW